MLKNPFVSTKHQFKMMPRISSNNAKDIVAKKLLWTYIGYWGTFFLWLIVSHNFIPMIFILGSLMWCAGGIAAMKLPEESSRIANKTRFYIFTYIAGLLAWRVVLNIIVETPVEMWERALMMRLPPAFASSFLGFITMTFVVGMFMGFVQHLSYIWQLFTFHRSSRKTTDYMDVIMRRGDEN